MHRMRHTPYVSILFFLLIIISTPVLSQDAVDPLRDPMNPELYSQKYSDKRILEQRIRSEVSKLQAEMRARDSAIPKNLPTTITQHVQRQEGVPFPTEKQLMEQSVLDPKIERQIVTAASDFYTKQNAKLPQAPIVVFSKCTQPKRERVEQFEPEQGDTASAIRADLLFIAKSDADDMDLKLFGAATRTFVVDPNKPNPADAFGQSLGVGCLPTRFLTTSKGQYRLEGIEALKNYDADPEGNGELPTYLKPRFEQRSK